MSSDWGLHTLEEITDGTPITYGVVKPGDESDDGIAFIRGGDIVAGRILVDQLRTITREVSAQYSRTLLRGGELLISLVGNPGEVAIAPPELAGANIARQVGLIRIAPEKAEKNYVQFFLRSKVGRDILLAHSRGSVQQVINLKELKSVKIPLPPKSVQKEIADFMQALDDRIALLRASNATLEAIAQAMFKSWLVDFDPVHAKQQGCAPEGMSEATAALFPDTFEEPELGLVPRGWSIGSIGKIAEVIDCLHAKKPELLTSGRPYLQLNNIRDDGLLDTSNLAFISDADYAKWISRIEVSGGDCVITNVGRVGAVAQIPESFRAAMGRNMTAIRMRKEWPYPTYLVELLQSPWMEAEIQRRTDIGTILNALNVRNIPLLRCVLAGHNILTAFEDTARPLRAVMEANLDRANTLATLRDTLLPRLISGQLRLPEVEAVLEEELV